MALSTQAALDKDRTNANASTGDLQHRHFAVIAGILRDLNATPQTIEQWAEKLCHTNPRFDRARFIRACQS